MKIGKFVILFVVFTNASALAIESCLSVLSTAEKVVVYRALVLESDNQALSIAENGMGSPFAIKTSTLTAEEQNQKLHNMLTTWGALNLIYQRYQKLSPGSLDMNPFMSVSSYPDVAVAVANSYKSDSTASVYLFRMELDSRDIIQLGKDYPYPTHIRIAQAMGLNTVIDFEDRQQNIYRFDENVEAFVYMRIPSRYIVGVYKVPATQAPLFKARFGKNEKRSIDENAFLQSLHSMPRSKTSSSGSSIVTVD